MKTCLICYRKENGTQQPHPDCDFICSNCVQKLCRASQEQIKAIYQKAVDQGLERKAEIFKTFIVEDTTEGVEIDGERNYKRNPVSKKCVDRKGRMRAFRNDKKPGWKHEISGSTLYRSQ